MLVDHLVYAAPDLGPRTYLEIIAPDPDQPTPPARRPFGIEDITCGKLVGWGVACDDIDQVVAEARSHGYDPGEVVDGHRVGPAGTVLRWRATGSSQADDLVPFLICWGGTEHPARSAPSGLILKSLHIEHPDPPSLQPPLMALGANVEVRQGHAPALVAYLIGPNGNKVLRC